MAFIDELKSFIEDRLLAFDPSLDISPGSTVQTQVVSPILDRLGEDPFAQDIGTFIQTRLLQEFPDLQADQGGVLADILSNPLRLLLEPFKREIEIIKQGQSLDNADVMNDEEADALIANWFETRREGGFTSGTARLFFSAPTTMSIIDTNAFFSNTGLVFFPVENTTVTAETMIFNRDGDFFFVDISIRAETPGEIYNLNTGDLIRVDDIPGVVKVTNLFSFTGGRDRESTTEFVARAEQALTERSLVTKRGVQARTTELFDAVRALQVIGAGEEGMDRDIIKGTGEGLLHVTGAAKAFGNWVLITPAYKDDGVNDNITVEKGDTLRFHKDPSADPSRVISEATVTRLLSIASGGDLLIEVDANLFSGGTTVGFAAVLKPGFITISDVPGGIDASVQVPNNTIHIGGHSDIFIRPTSDSNSTTVFDQLIDEAPIVISKDIDVTSDIGLNQVSINIGLFNGTPQAGDLLVIDTVGVYAGTHRILEVESPGGQLRVDTVFPASTTGLRGKVIRSITMDLVEPRVLKLPFDTGTISDASFIVGSPLIKFDSTDTQQFGVAVGDVIRILDTDAAGDYVIQGFDTLLGGQGAIVDRNLSLSSANVKYEIFTVLDPVNLPLVRLTDLEVLDASGQVTGVKVPYGDAVDVRAVCDFEGAGNDVVVFDKAIITMPDITAELTGFAPTSITPGAGKDARFSQEIEPADGIIHASLWVDPANTITESEINIPPFIINSKRDTFMALVHKPDTEFTTANSSEVHETSDLAESKIGDSFTITSGPNTGSYRIKDIRIMDLWGTLSTDIGHKKIALVQVDKPFKVDTMRTAMDFIADITPGSALTPEEAVSIFDLATVFFIAGGFFDILITRLVAAFTAAGFTFTTEDVDELLRADSVTSYSSGPSSTGDVRLYFKNPVSIEIDSNAPATLSLASDSDKKFRLTTDKFSQIFPESESDDPPSEWLRTASTEQPSSEYLFIEGDSFPLRGIRDATDTVEFHPAINDVSSARDKMKSSWLAVTGKGINIITMLIPNAANGNINETDIDPGQLLFIDSGPDLGAFTITSVLFSDFSVNPATAVFAVDRIMNHSTLPFPTSGAEELSFVNGEITSGDKNLVVLVADPRFSDLVTTGALNGKFITIYAAESKAGTPLESLGDDTGFLGTYEITDIVDDGPDKVITLGNKATNWPQIESADETLLVRWLLHEAPSTIPADGIISDQYVRARLYGEVALDRTFDIEWSQSLSPLDSDSTKQIRLFEGVTPTGWATSGFGHKNPFRVIRPGITKVSSTSMSSSKDGALYFLELTASSVGAESEFNIPENSALVVDTGVSFQGYQLLVANKNLTYSTQERSKIILPAAVLPVGSTPGFENELLLSGQSLQLKHTHAPLIGEIQSFFDSPTDRVVNSNPLVKHFLPGYVHIFASYTGGNEPSAVAIDFINFINSIPPEDNQLRVDDLIRILQTNGAIEVTLPITVIALVHGVDRKIRTLRSQNSIGGASGQITFDGSSKMLYFIPGPDTSEDEPLPDGEQVFLERF